MVECRLCGQVFEVITWSHLKFEHNTSSLEYSKMFPRCPISSEESRQRKSEALMGNQCAVGSHSRAGYVNSGEASRVTGAANRAIWASLTEEEKKARLESSFHSDEAKRKSRETKIANWEKLSLEERQEIASHSFQSEEAIRRNKEAQARKDISGDRNPNWGNFRGKGAPRIYGWGWSDIAFFIHVRDGWKCQKCGTKDFSVSNLITCHHINHDTENIEDANLITLCRSCNASVNGNDKDYWVAFFRARIEEIYCAAAI